jgi:dihydropteroate synthase
MGYREAVNRLERLRRHRPKLGTETTGSLVADLGYPFEVCPRSRSPDRTGKGSTARLLEGILQDAGLDVGLYT